MPPTRPEAKPISATRASRLRDLSRRQLLGIVGGAVASGLAAGNRRLLGAIGRPRAGGTAMGERTVDEHIAQMCVVAPEQTEGPYFVDEKLNRSDVRSDPSDGKVKEGVPLRLVIRVFRTDRATCVPLAGAVVDVWQCDALGVYSDVRDTNGFFDTRGQKFLRGYQATSGAGVAEFLTIYPGWYQGRTVHIHFKVRTDPSSPQGYEFTSQLYFDDAVTDRVLTRAPYASKGARTVRNGGDGIYRQGGDRLMLRLAEDGDGYVGTFDIALDMGPLAPTAEPTAAPTEPAPRATPTPNEPAPTATGGESWRVYLPWMSRRRQ